MGDTVGAGCLGAICNAVVESFQMTVCMTNNWGATCCKPLDTLCRCKCCWSQGELPTDDYPDANRQAKQLERDYTTGTGTDTGDDGAGASAPPPAYQPTQQPTIPTTASASGPAPASAAPAA